MFHENLLVPPQRVPDSQLPFDPMRACSASQQPRDLYHSLIHGRASVNCVIKVTGCEGANPLIHTCIFNNKGSVKLVDVKLRSLLVEKAQVPLISVCSCYLAFLSMIVCTMQLGCSCVNNRSLEIVQAHLKQGKIYTQITGGKHKSSGH